VKEFEKVLKAKLKKMVIVGFPQRTHSLSTKTGVTLNQKAQKIIAVKGRRSIISAYTLEKGKTITAICCVSAVGVYCPPMIIYPRARFKQKILDRRQIGSVGTASKTDILGHHNGVCN